jgi:hypothetical protein
MSKGPVTVFNEIKEQSEEQIILQTECFVLLQMLCNFKPSLYDELGISQDIEDIVGSGTAMIEIVWRGDIHRRFFHVPKVCEFLAKSSKDKLVEVVDRSNAENKLIDFLNRSHVLYLEIKHQQLLTEMNLSTIFSREVQNRATWTTFLFAIVINILFIFFYEATNGTDDSSQPVISNKVAESVIYALNLSQTLIASFVLFLWIVVRTPVNYQSFKLLGYSDFKCIISTATESMTMYYFFYLVLSILGLTVANYFLPFLLLDIVAKNSTTRDVLNAVILPRKQLAMTLVLALFMNYIFAYFYVRLIFKY